MSSALAIPGDGDDRQHNDTHYEIDLGDAPPAAAPITVDLTKPREDWLPVIPPHLRGAANIKRTLARAGGRWWHKTRFHSLRSPVYLGLATFWALIGVLKTIGLVLRWWWVAEQAGPRIDAAKRRDGKDWHQLHKDWEKSWKTRTGWVVFGAVVIVIGVVLLVTVVPWWGDAAAAWVAFVLLARFGHPADRRIIAQAVVAPRFRVLNADVVLRAYYAAGLGNPDKPGQQITFGSPMRRDGDGSGVDVDLPYGKGLDDAIKAKPGIASGLDVTTSQVFIHRNPESHRRHRLWVADRDPLAVPVGRTPLLACKQSDIWNPAPLGLDERGALVTVPLMWNSVLISALPRAGKTFSARLLGLYAALDPYVQMSVFDFKGSPDWRKFALVADRCAFGLTPTRDGLPLEIFASTLLELKADAQDRYQRLSELPADVCPEGKLTRDIARNPRYRMPVRVLILEEFQEVYDLGEASKEIASLLTFLVKVAPGAGIILIGSTQRPSGVGSGGVAQAFTSFRDNFGIRFGLRTSSWQVSELCLGAGAYSEGLDTSTLLPQYKGVGILRGATDASPTVRTYLADGQDAERILTAARAVRERAGTLGGMAAGQVTGGPRDVLADVRAVFGSDTGLHWAVLAERLARQFPDRWADATADAISAQCRDLGVPTVQIKMGGRNLQGCRKADIEQSAGRP